MKNNLSIVTVHKDEEEDLKKTCLSLDLQSIQPNLHLIIAKKLSKSFVKLFSKKNRKFIIGKDKSLFNAMNIGLRYTKKDYVLFLNSGDKFFSKNSTITILKNIKKNPRKCLIFKTSLHTKLLVFDIKKKYFENFHYSPHPSFIRPPFKKKILFNEKLKIAADALWMKENSKVHGYKKIFKNLSSHYLGGQSTNPTINSVSHQFKLSLKEGAKEITKFVLKKILITPDLYYSLIYFYKMKISRNKNEK
jgi:hypothetical protein